MSLNTLADGLSQAYAMRGGKLADEIPRGLRAKTDIVQERFRVRMNALGIATVRTVGERIYKEPEEVSQRILDAFLSHAGA